MKRRGLLDLKTEMEVRGNVRTNSGIEVTVTIVFVVGQESTGLGTRGQLRQVRGRELKTIMRR